MKNILLSYKGIQQIYKRRVSVKSNNGKRKILSNSGVDKNWLFSFLTKKHLIEHKNIILLTNIFFFEMLPIKT